MTKTGWKCILFVQKLKTILFNLSKECFLFAIVPTTGTPSSFDNKFKLILIPFFSASSSKLTQTITLEVISIVWYTKFKLFSKQVASITTIVASGFWKQIKSLAISSSSEFDIKEYVPGISKIKKFLLLYSKYPEAFETVFPGQLPVCWCIPVKLLNIVDLPTLGLPAKPIVKSWLWIRLLVFIKLLPVDEEVNPIKSPHFIILMIRKNVTI